MNVFYLQLKSHTDQTTFDVSIGPKNGRPRPNPKALSFAILFLLATMTPFLLSPFFSFAHEKMRGLEFIGPNETLFISFRCKRRQIDLSFLTYFEEDHNGQVSD